MTSFTVNDRLRELVGQIRGQVEQTGTSPKQRLAAYRQGDHPYVLPVYLVTHAYAGKHLGESTERFFSNFTLHCQGQLELTLLLGHEYIYHAVDIFDLEAEALGAGLEFPTDHSNPSLVALPLSHNKDFGPLKMPDPHRDGRVPELLAMKRFLQDSLGDLFQFEATGSSPFSLAANLRGFDNFLMDMLTEPDYAHELLEFCVEVCRVHLKSQLDLGLSGIHIADAWAAFPLVNPDIYEQFIFPAVSKLFGSLPDCDRTWTGLYGLSHISHWKDHLKDIIACGATELCVYQEDLQELDLGALATLAREEGWCLKVGLYGTTLSPYDSLKVAGMLAEWAAALGIGGRLAIHVSNVPWTVEREDLVDLLRQIRGLELKNAIQWQGGRK